MVNPPLHGTHQERLIASPHPWDLRAFGCRNAFTPRNDQCVSQCSMLAILPEIFHTVFEKGEVFFADPALNGMLPTFGMSSLYTKSIWSSQTGCCAPLSGETVRQIEPPT